MAKHIIGGEIFYTCLKVDTVKKMVTLKFTMNIYRDCGSDGAALDPDAEIGIYVKNNDQNFSYFATESWPLISRAKLVSNNTCVITPPNVCVEKGFYQKTLILPILDKPYYLVYQRCCRNESITNIINPGSDGAAYTIEISPEAQRTCNNSPSFKNFPPIIICLNKDINFDHSAIDIDGDQITYEFCTPDNAGGKRGSGDLPGDAKACDGVTPDPSRCPPPFQSVIFKTPFYTALTPMGGNPVITINPLTGLISGTPVNAGQYVVGVCIKEYRNGILLTTIRRDFQFNVIACVKNIDAKITADSIKSDNQFIVNACGNKMINIQNTSTIKNNIHTYEWDFDIAGKNVIYKTENVQLDLPDLGQYRGFLYLNKDEPECSDTAEIIINVFPGIDAEYSYVYDTCIAGPVQFTDHSQAPLSNIIKWQYLFEPGKTGNFQNPSYEFRTPGNKLALLKITDNNGCVDTFSKGINYYPVPALIVLDPNTFAGCEPLDVEFKNLSYPIDKTYDILWEFGDGTTSKEISPKHSFNEGNFSVKLSIKSPIGCQTDKSFPNWINVSKSPIADFEYDPKKLSNLENKIQITDLSKFSEKLFYLIDEKTKLNLANPSYTFRDTGVHKISQIVTRLNGCSDTLTQFIDVEPIVTYYMPNAFTPDGLGPNETFGGVGITQWMGSFDMTIWDRWGGLIYETKDPTKPWNGQFENSGELLQPGVYVYKVKYLTPRGKEVNLKGYATLIR